MQSNTNIPLSYPNHAYVDRDLHARMSQKKDWSSMMALEMFAKIDGLYELKNSISFNIYNLYLRLKEAVGFDILLSSYHHKEKFLFAYLLYVYVIGILWCLSSPLAGFSGMSASLKIGFILLLYPCVFYFASVVHSVFDSVFSILFACPYTFYHAASSLEQLLKVMAYACRCVLGMERSMLLSQLDVMGMIYSASLTWCPLLLWVMLLLNPMSVVVMSLIMGVSIINNMRYNKSLFSIAWNGYSLIALGVGLTVLFNISPMMAAIYFILICTALKVRVPVYQWAARDIDVEVDKNSYRCIDRALLNRGLLWQITSLVLYGVAGSRISSVAATLLLITPNMVSGSLSRMLCIYQNDSKVLSYGHAMLGVYWDGYNAVIAYVLPGVSWVYSSICSAYDAGCYVCFGGNTWGYRGDIMVARPVVSSENSDAVMTSVVGSAGQSHDSTEGRAVHVTAVALDAGDELEGGAQMAALASQ